MKLREHGMEGLLGDPLLKQTVETRKRQATKALDLKPRQK